MTTFLYCTSPLNLLYRRLAKVTYYGVDRVRDTPGNILTTKLTLPIETKETNVFLFSSSLYITHIRSLLL